MTDIFKTKAEPPERTSAEHVPVGLVVSQPNDEPVRVAQTLRELHRSRRADDAMSVVNRERPRKGHAY